MTDPMELVGRLEAHDGSHERGCEGRNMSCTCGDDERGQALLTEAAACIREMVEKLDRWEPKPVSRPSVTVSCHVGGNNSPLPPAPGAEQ